MRLSWEFSYEDYNDTLNWNKRFDELCDLRDSLDVEQLKQAGEETFLECLEGLEELLRFYTAKADFVHLEPVMRSYQQLLAIGEERAIKHTGFLYLKMVFARVNGMLYRHQDQNKQAAVYYGEFMSSARVCFEQLKKEKELTDQQILYVGWACIEGAFEAAQVFDKLLGTKNFVQCCAYILEVAEWLTPYLFEGFGICEKTSEVCASISAFLYQAGEIKLGKACMEKAIFLFEELDSKCDLAYYAARALWTRGQYGLIEFVNQGNADIMLKCEANTRKFMAGRAIEKHDQAIAKGVMGMIHLQRSVVIQQSGNLREAIETGEESCELLADSLAMLEAEYNSSNAHMEMVLKEMAAKVFGNYISALDSLGVQFFYNQEGQKAKETLLKAIKLIESNSIYTFAETGSMLVKGELYFYLGVIYMEEADADRASFYAVQSADILYELWHNTPAQNVLDLSVAGCLCTVEIMLALKNKTEAAKYAQMGLEACDALCQVAPGSERLQMRSTLEKYRKKAMRKFF